MLIFGSTALKHWFPDLKREPKDLDYIGLGKSSPNIEFHWVPSFQYILDNNKDSRFVDPNFLYTIKISHACYDIRWDKTMFDIQFMKNKGCKIDNNLYQMLLKDWEVIHHKKKIKLGGTPNQFFNSNITRKIDHDELHKLVMFYETPLHEKIRQDKNNVKVSKQLWDQLSFEDQIKCASEEAYVFAIERYIDYPPRIALIKALKQLITSSTKGYFNLFIIDNFETLRYNISDKYLKVIGDIINGQEKGIKSV